MTNCRLMSLNMLTDGLYNFGDSRFKIRIKALRQMLRETEPDLIGTQELTERMKPYLEKELETYGMTGDGRGSVFSDEYSAILYRKDRYELLNSATFWLSDTPGKAGSRFFLSQFPRIVTMAYLREKESGKVISFYNTHLDHNFASVRIKQAAVLAEIIRRTKKGTAVFVSGDFNDVPDSEPLKQLGVLGLHDLADERIGSTLRGKIGSAVHKQEPIDHILVSCDPGKCSVEKLDRKFAGYHPTDHYPLLADIEF